jgi:hypothetical protein
MNNLKFHRLSGQEAKKYALELAKLRLKVFFDFPYLYVGTLEYEMNYLETYFKAKHAFIFLIEDKGQIVGATTSIWAEEEVDNFKKPFELSGINPKDVFYFGESVLLSEYRGLGIGKIFFQERETFARTLPFINLLSFCAVIRPSTHPLKPQGYQPLDSFWHSQGFQKNDGLTTTYEWKDRGDEKESAKQMQFWTKLIK